MTTRIQPQHTVVDADQRGGWTKSFAETPQLLKNAFGAPVEANPITITYTSFAL